MNSRDFVVLLKETSNDMVEYAMLYDC